MYRTQNSSHFFPSAFCDTKINYRANSGEFSELLFQCFPSFQDFVVVHDYLASPNHKMQARIRRRGQNGKSLQLLCHFIHFIFVSIVFTFLFRFTFTFNTRYCMIYFSVIRISINLSYLLIHVLVYLSMCEVLLISSHFPL